MEVPSPSNNVVLFGSLHQCEGFPIEDQFRGLYSEAHGWGHTVVEKDGRLWSKECLHWSRGRSGDYWKCTKCSSARHCLITRLGQNRIKNPTIEANSATAKLLRTPYCVLTESERAKFDAERKRQLFAENKALKAEV